MIAVGRVAGIVAVATLALAVVLAGGVPLFSNDLAQDEVDLSSSHMRFAEVAVADADRFRPTCDMTAESGICLFGGQKIIMPEAKPKGLLAYYTFDDVRPIDQSGNQNHPVGVVPTGPGRGGRGASASFEGSNYLQVPSSETLARTTPRFTVSFWINIMPDASDANLDCSIVAMGSAGSTVFEIAYNGQTGHLSAAADNHRLRVTSFARPRVGTWHHVAVSLGKEHFTFHVNGVRDGSLKFDPNSNATTMPLYDFYAGRVSFLDSSECFLPFLLDDVRVYDRSLTSFEIEAESFPSLGAIEPKFIRFGCEKCGLAQAQDACKAQTGYHLCYAVELASGAKQAAFRMGYVSNKDTIWEEDPVDMTDTDKAKRHATADGEKRVGICCAL